MDANAKRLALAQRLLADTLPLQMVPDELVGVESGA